MTSTGSAGADRGAPPSSAGRVRRRLSGAGGSAAAIAIALLWTVPIGLAGAATSASPVRGSPGANQA